MFARHPQPCPQGECFERVTEVRDGECSAQHTTSPDERVVSCSDETHGHLTTGGKAWLVAAGVAAPFAIYGELMLLGWMIGHTAD